MSYRETLIPANWRGYPYVFISRAKIYVSDGVVVFSSSEEFESRKIYNIPYLNTALLVLGKGVSITSEAINVLLSNKTLVLSITNGLNLHAVIYPEDSLNNNKYARILAEKVFNENSRIELAKNMLERRLVVNSKLFEKNEILSEVYSDFEYKFNGLKEASSIEEILGIEGAYTKKLQNYALELFCIDNKDEFNRRVKLINSLCYGAASVALTSLGIPFMFNIFHGRTNSGSLKYDIADLYKGISIFLAGISMVEDAGYGKDGTNDELLKYYSEILFFEFDILNIAFEEVLNIVKD